MLVYWYAIPDEYIQSTYRCNFKIAEIGNQPYNENLIFIFRKLIKERFW